MTRAASEPHRRHVGGITWTRDGAGVYFVRVKNLVFVIARTAPRGPAVYMLTTYDGDRGTRAGSPWPLAGLDRSIKEANALVRKARAQHDLALQSPDVKYPEHEKVTQVKDEAQKLGEFLHWLGTQGIFLATPDPRADRFGGHVLIAEDHEKVVARYFQVDLKKLEEEKRAMLAALRKENGA